MTAQQKQDNLKRWMDARKKQGWRRVELFVPSPLALLIREQARNWKHANHTFYKNMK